MNTATLAEDISALDFGTRVDAYDWSSIPEHLDAHSWAIFPKLLSVSECAVIAGLYADDRHFRSHIVMAWHGFGRGEYKYFAYPLPEKIADLRTALYPRLASIANRWNASMEIDVCYPDAHAAFIEKCHEAGQTRPPWASSSTTHHDPSFMVAFSAVSRVDDRPGQGTMPVAAVTHIFARE